MSNPTLGRGSTAGLGALAGVELNAHHGAMLAAARAACGGSKPWRCRKIAEARDVLALAQLSGRLLVFGIDLATDLRLHCLMRVAVPLLPDPAKPPRVGDTAQLGIVYREAGMFTAQPGYSFVQILAPHPVWHPNVSPDFHQILCLGPRLAAGIPLREIILMTYGALTMMTVQLDPANSAGLLNPASAALFQRNTKLIPLSREPFLRPETPSK
jgi:hypothetical protein